MNRNIAIVIIILVLVVLAGYLVWIRSKLAPVVSPVPQIQEPTSVPVVVLSPILSASPSGTLLPTPTKAQKVATPTANPL